jgi:hypothetical protein
MRLRELFITVVTVALLASVVMADDQFQPKNLAFGIKAGLVTGGTVNYQFKGGHSRKQDYSTDDGLDVGIFIEQDVYRRVKATLTADAHNIRQGDPANISEFMIDVALGAKLACFIPNSRFAIRPGVCIGYGHLSETVYFPNSRYLTLKIYSEFVQYTIKGGGVLLEVGMAWAPSGSATDMDLSAGPMMLLRGGLVF